MDTKDRTFKCKNCGRVFKESEAMRVIKYGNCYVGCPEYSEKCKHSTELEEIKNKKDGDIDV